jgi:hypothetical protein
MEFPYQAAWSSGGSKEEKENVPDESLSDSHDGYQTLKSRLGFKSSGRERPANRTTSGIPEASCGGIKRSAISRLRSAKTFMADR